MRVGLLQYSMHWENKAANRTLVRELLQRAPEQKLAWVVLPEMALTGFSVKKDYSGGNDEDLAFFSELARELKIAISFGSSYQRRNRLITVDREGKQISEYSKVHVFSPGGEGEVHDRGTKAEAFKVEGLQVLPTVCYDLRFPYLYWNAPSSVEAMVVVASWPAKRAQHWRTLLQARAIENQCYVIGVNRTGNDPFLAYQGDSLIVGPTGEMVLDTQNREGLFCAELDPERVAEARIQMPIRRDRLEGVTP